MSVFGALNRFISRLDAEPQTQRSGSRGAAGFQVLRNTNPELQIEPYFDFIIGINGRTIDNPDPALFGAEVRNCAGGSVELGLWSAKGQRIRSLWVQVPADTASLSLSLQWKPLAATEEVWHILDVSPNSPADNAGLLPYGDYIIGSPEALVKGESGMGELVEQFLDRSLRLWVYNHEYNVTRLVTMEPSRSWGGTGALGCILGYGALHRIPPSLEEPPQAPGETMFETIRTSTEQQPGYAAAQTYDLPHHSTPGENDSHVFTPANMDASALPSQSNVGSTISPPPMASAARKAPPRGGRRAAPSGLDMDDYFREGEAKSKEVDFTSSSKGNVPPPPPRADGPPRSSSLVQSTTETIPEAAEVAPEVAEEGKSDQAEEASAP